MKQRTAEGLTAFVAGILAFICIFLFMQQAGATGNNHNDDINVSQNQHQDQTATGGDAVSASDSVSTSSASNDGVQVGGDTSNVENNSSTVVLVPNNNTESCVRVFGLAFGKNGESGAIGFPWRSAKCDYEQAADDAFAAGERDLGWFWKCQNKNLYKRFQSKDESDESAIGDCHTRMLADARDDVVADLQKQVEDANRRAQTAEELAELAKAHERVCNESLGKCENKLYTSK